MRKRIFISYRRSDARDYARSVYQRLQKDFGSGRLFMDVESIAKGRDFKAVLEQALDATAVMLVLIGEQWLDACDETGRRRLDDPDDFVHMEVAYALKRGLVIIPVLIDSAPPPASARLPDDMRPLADRQASWLRHGNFSPDMDGIAKEISRYIPRSRRRQITVLATVLAVILAFSAYVWLPRPWQPPQNTVVIDKAAFVELLKTYNQRSETSQASMTDENARLLKLVNDKLSDADGSYAEFVKRTTDLLAKLERLRTLISSQIISEAKAAGESGDFRKAKSALQELLHQAETGKAEPAVAAEFGESVARAFAAVGDLSQAIETYADTVAAVAPTGRLIRGYVEALLAAGQFQRAVSIVEKTLDPTQTSTTFNPTDIAWMNDALGQAYENLGKVAIAKEKYALAFQLMRTSLRDGRAAPADLAQILNDMTAVSIRTNDFRRAKESLCESIRLNSENGGAKARAAIFPRLNLVGVSRQMGLLGAARQQLDEVKADIDSGLPADDPLRGGAIIHAALLAIAGNSSDAGLQAITEAQGFFDKLASKGQGFQQRMARIEQIKGFAHFYLGQWPQAYEREQVSKDLFRRAFGGLSADELTSTFWLARSSLALNRRDEAEALLQSLRSGIPTFEKEPGLLTLQADALEAELGLTGGHAEDAKVKLEKTTAALFDIEARGEGYLALADDCIRLLLAADKKDASFEAITLYRQARGQRTLVRAGGGSPC